MSKAQINIKQQRLRERIQLFIPFEVYQYVIFLIQNEREQSLPLSETKEGCKDYNMVYTNSGKTTIEI